MSTWRPPWSAQGQFTATLLPPTRAGNSVTARRPPWARIDGCAACGLAGSCTPDLSTYLGWPGFCRQPPRVHPGGGRFLGATPRPTVAPNSPREENPGRRQPTPPDHSARPSGCGEAEKSLSWWAGKRCEHGDAETHWQRPRRRRRTDGPRLQRTPNLRPGPLHRPALPVQPHPALLDPPRVGPAAGNSAATPPPLRCRGPIVSSTRFIVVSHALRPATSTTRREPLLTPGTARTAVLPQRLQGRVSVYLNLPG
jgi:hypothetical protein